MKTSTLAIFTALLTAAPLFADGSSAPNANKKFEGSTAATPIEKKSGLNAGNGGATAIQPASAKKTAPAEAKPAPAKKHKGLFDGELNKDRSLPAGEKVPMTDDKPVDPPYKHLNKDLHKDRG